ncbi:transferase [Streptomyces sp. NPDC096040]|uniref:transferase n=1 Tax=Streptomyces sp. NPDC096040 TaxID=3155541 RepID=UPI00332E29BF
MTEDQRQHEPRCHCTIDEDGNITWSLELPEAREPRLLLRRRTKPAGTAAEEQPFHVLALEKSSEGRWTAVQSDLPSLAEGRWDVCVVDQGQDERRARPGLRDLRLLLDGSRREWTSPVAVRIPYATKDGYLAVRTWLRTAHAETQSLRVDSEGMTVSARLHGRRLGPRATVALRHRQERTLHPLPLRQADEHEFSFRVDYAKLLRPEPVGPYAWDVFVQPEKDADKVRIGKLFDDIPDRKEIFDYPATRLGKYGEYEVRPYYTVNNDLAVEVNTRSM